MKNILGLIILIIFSYVSAQTPSIMLKRLRCSNEDLVTSLKKPNSPIRQSNFGLPPTIYLKRAVIDSIIVINDSSVLVVTSHQIKEELQWCGCEFDTVGRFFFFSDSMLLKSLSYDSTGMWKPGRDLLINHGIFNSKYTCEEILTALDYKYRLNHATENTVFVGFDCSSKRKSKRGEWVWLTIPITKDPNLWFGLALAISILYYIFLKAKQLKSIKLA